jgi:hypothetical protein
MEKVLAAAGADSVIAVMNAAPRRARLLSMMDGSRKSALQSFLVDRPDFAYYKEFRQAAYNRIARLHLSDTLSASITNG